LGTGEALETLYGRLFLSCEFEFRESGLRRGCRSGVRLPLHSGYGWSLLQAEPRQQSLQFMEVGRQAASSSK
jgi:hypothetical protein